jgi:Arc/MetJ family transcription regulator
MAYDTVCVPKKEKTMQKNIALDDNLVKEAMELSGITSDTILLHEALKTFVRYQRNELANKQAKELRGKIEFWPGYREEICPAGPANG